MLKYYLLIVIGIAFSACNNTNSINDTKIAKVEDKILYLSEISEIIPNNSSIEDSLLLVNNYTKQWIKKQLLIKKAELNLLEIDENVDKLIEEYRSSLIIHNYQRILIEQKLDTVVSSFEIEQYYKEYNNNFVLSKNIIKALFIKIQKPVPNKDWVHKAIRSDSDETLNKLESYCYQNATKYDHFGDQWIYSETMLDKLPLKIKNEELFLKRNKYIETQDSTYEYFVKIHKVQFRNTKAPIIFVKDNIKQIIVNKRKIDFIENMEKSIYNDARAKNEFKIY